MKFKLLSVLILVCSLSFGQNDTTKYSKYPNVYGLQYPRLWATKVLNPPNDTTYSKDGIAIKGNNVYIGNGSYWSTVSGGSGGSGTVNSGTQYRLGYYASTGTAISQLAAITGNRALISDANGLPTHSVVTATELGYLSGLTSNAQVQFNAKQATITLTTTGTSGVATFASNVLNIPNYTGVSLAQLVDSLGNYYTKFQVDSLFSSGTAINIGNSDLVSTDFVRNFQLDGFFNFQNSSGNVLTIASSGALQSYASAGQTMLLANTGEITTYNPSLSSSIFNASSQGASVSSFNGAQSSLVQRLQITGSDDIANFRIKNSDLYIDNISSTDQDNFLVINDDGKVTKIAKSSISFPTPNLQQVTDAGGSTTTSFSQVGQFTTIKQENNSNADVFSQLNNNSNSGQLSLGNSTTFRAVVSADSILGSSKLHQLPNADGTISLYPVDSTGSPNNMIYYGTDGLFHKAAVPSGGGGSVGTLQQVAYNGNISKTALRVYDSVFTDIYAEIRAGSFRLRNSPGTGVEIKADNVVSGLQELQAPDESGTIALRATDSTGSPQNMIYQNSAGLFVKAAVPSGGGGTVTSASVVSANGFAGTVATATTTPAITLSTTINSPVLAGNGTAISAATTTGSGSTVVLATSPTLVTPILGTPTSVTLTNGTGLPILSGVSGLGTGVATFLATPSSANLLAAITDETGTGLSVFNNTPTLITPTVAAINGGTAANDDITIQGTTNATRASSYVILQPTAGNVGIGTTTPTYLLDVNLGNANNVRLISGTGEKNGFLTSTFSNFIFASNAMFDGSSFLYEKNGFAASVQADGNAGNIYLNTYTSGTAGGAVSAGGTKFTLLNNGNIGFGVSSPSATLHLKAGTATASTAPMKWTSGTKLTTIEAFTKEADARGFYSSNVALNRYAEGGKIYGTSTDVSNTSTTETDLVTYTTKASTLGATDESLVFDISGTLNDITATAQIQFYFAGTNIGNTGALTVSSTGGWSARVIIIRSGSTTAKAMVTVTTPGASTAAYTSVTSLTGLTFTNTNIIKCTGTAGSAGGGSGDITASAAQLIWWGATAN